MGSEFLKRAKASINKQVDKKRVELALGDLFTQLPTRASRSVLVNLTSDCIEEGDRLIIEVTRDDICATINGMVVGHFPNATGAFVSAMKDCGVAVGEVIQLNKISNTAEVTVS